MLHRSPGIGWTYAGARQRGGRCSMTEEGVVEDSMFDEQIATTAEEIKEARKALVKLGLDVARRGIDAKFNEAQIVFANANARMELAPLLPPPGRSLRLPAKCRKMPDLR